MLVSSTFAAPARDSRRRAWAEIGAVLLTGLVYLFFENVLRVKLPFLVPCVLLWTAYIVVRLRREPGLKDRWGLAWRSVKQALPACSVVFAAAALGLLAYRLLAGWRPIPPSAGLVFAIYPVWALLQQFVVQALVAENLRRLGARPWLVVPVASVLFGIAHLPDWPLVALCAAAGLAWTPLFLRTRSLYPLALSHAWLGALAYYWVLERDPWRQLFPGP